MARASARALARASARLGAYLGGRLRRALCRGLPRLRPLPPRLWDLDGQGTVAVCAALLRPALHSDGDQYLALRRSRRERNNVPGLAAVRLLHAPAPVDQGAPGHLHSALGATGGSCLYLLPLDADGRAESCRRSIASAVWHPRSDLVPFPRPRARVQYHRLRLEMASVLDRGLPRRTDRYSAGDLRSG